VNLGVDVAATFTAEGTDEFQVEAGFEVEDGETVVVLGPSGSGKTLLLETIAGFHDHDGAITLDGERIGHEPPEDRHFGFVFQDYALFPHMTIRENVAFGATYRGETRDPDTLLSDLGIAALADRYPPRLSGGEKQRVALARALAVRPAVLLLDEPLSSLDVPSRQSLRAELATLLANETVLHVTHDRTTARALADRIVVMSGGEVVQTGTPEEIFERPASPLVARFTGSNCLPRDAIPALADRLREEGTHVAIRPEVVQFAEDGSTPDVTATVERVTREDATSRVVLSLVTGSDDESIRLDAYSDDPPAVGDTVGLSIPADSVTIC